MVLRGLRVLYSRTAPEHASLWTKPVLCGPLQDGRLMAGDQLVSVNKESLIGVTYEEARSIITRTKLRCAGAQPLHPQYKQC